jgi:hypothetical protein
MVAAMGGVYARRMLLAAAVLISGLPAAAEAHDLVGLIAERERLSPEILAEIEDYERQVLISSALAYFATGGSDIGSALAVYAVYRTWAKADIPVRVCFFDGEEVAREHVASVVDALFQGTGMAFDFRENGAPRRCGTTPDIPVRVSFLGQGHSSYRP